MKHDYIIFICAILIIVAGQVSYHSIARTVSHDREPFTLIVTAYGFAFLIVLIVGIITQQIHFKELIESYNYKPAIGLGIAVSFIELGYIYAYKNGLPINIGAFALLGLTTIILIPVGYFVFKEMLSLRIALGLALLVTGLWLISTR